MKKLLWILTLVLIFIFSLPYKTNTHSNTKVRLSQTQTRFCYKQHFKENDDSITLRITSTRVLYKSDPQHRARRKKGKIIFSNNVLLPSGSKDDFKTSKLKFKFLPNTRTSIPMAFKK